MNTNVSTSKYTIKPTSDQTNHVTAVEMGSHANTRLGSTKNDKKQLKSWRCIFCSNFYFCVKNYYDLEDS